MLPEVRGSSEVYGEATLDSVAGVPVAGDLGDQQAALFGQTCFAVGEAKNTYGTGNFLLLNTGTEAVPSKNGLITTAGYKIGDQPTVFALEGSIAITGALVQWLRDNLKLIKAAPDVEELAESVDDNGGVYFVPAFSGLFAPYWRSDARGVIAGMTRYVTAGHIARATLEATAYQSREVVEAMNADSGVDLESLKVDGGMVQNELLMQFQSDLLGVDVIRPAVAETTALGAAYAGGLATGLWKEQEDLRENWVEDKRWSPSMDEKKRDRLYRDWKKAVTKSFDWVEGDDAIGDTLECDVLVIGGGATGLGVVRDAAMRGFRAVLLERVDLGQGTTGRFHGLLHSGGRYVTSDPQSATECAEENVDPAAHRGRRHRGHRAASSSRRRPTTPATPSRSSRAAGRPACRCRRSPSPRPSPASRGSTRASAAPSRCRTGRSTGGSCCGATPRSAREHGARILTYHWVTSILRDGDRVVGAVAPRRPRRRRRAHRGRLHDQRRRGLGGPDRRHGGLPRRHGGAGQGDHDRDEPPAGLDGDQPLRPARRRGHPGPDPHHLRHRHDRRPGPTTRTT